MTDENGFRVGGETAPRNVTTLTPFASRRVRRQELKWWQLLPTQGSNYPG